MRLETRKYLFDIQEAAGLAAGFVAGKNFADYQADPMLRFAVERAFLIIGEALTRLGQLDEACASRISEYRSIVAFRNILVHAYAQIDDRIVWGVLEAKLPLLQREVAGLMDEGHLP
ncbi:MAG TPA: HepT-like ribonuclease domain-containing protein [Acidobacteriaceae bacterium]|jgi:uncharacterized protein with HEPN domain|nr:HepT-like ribonuclease domain-containing protein [Acidobacteriaceae bacterium]